MKKKAAVRIIVWMVLFSLIIVSAGCGLHSQETVPAAAATLPVIWEISPIRIETAPPETLPPETTQETTEETTPEETTPEETTPVPATTEPTTPEPTTPEPTTTLPETEEETTTVEQWTGGEITEDNLDEYCRYLVRAYSLYSSWAVYDYVRYHFKYHLRDKLDSERAMAIRMFNTGNGPCYDYDCVMALLLKVIGVNSYMVVGQNANGSEHDWLLFEMSPGVWRHVDPYRGGWTEMFGLFGLTDAQLRDCKALYNLTYIWDDKVFTSESPTGTGPAFTGR